MGGNDFHLLSESSSSRVLLLTRRFELLLIPLLPQFILFLTLTYFLFNGFTDDVNIIKTTSPFDTARSKFMLHTL